MNILIVRVKVVMYLIYPFMYLMYYVFDVDVFGFLVMNLLFWISHLLYTHHCSFQSVKQTVKGFK